MWPFDKIRKLEAEKRELQLELSSEKSKHVNKSFDRVSKDFTSRELEIMLQDKYCNIVENLEPLIHKEILSVLLKNIKHFKNMRPVFSVAKCSKYEVYPIQLKIPEMHVWFEAIGTKNLENW